MKNILKLSAVAGCAGLLFANSLFADDFVCDNKKIDAIFSTSTVQGVKILKAEPSLDVSGACDIFLNANGKIDLVYAFLDKNELIAGGTAVIFNPETKQFAPKNLQRIQSLMLEEENKTYTKAMEILKDNKKLDEFYSLAKVEYTKDATKSFDNKKYDFLVFESLECPYCKEFNGMLEQNYSGKNLKLFKYYLPLSQGDYNNLKTNYYKDEESLRKAITLKNELPLQGVPMVVVRDAKTKKVVDVFRSPNAPINFEKVKKYLN